LNVVFSVGAIKGKTHPHSSCPVSC